MISCTHSAEDDRIYKKEALSLQRNGYDVSHICYGSEYRDYITDDGIHIIQLKKKKRTANKWDALKQLRMNDILDAAKKTAASVYHLHDLELCRIASRLQRLPQHPKVIYDAHEPYGDNFKDYWKNRSLSKVLLSDIPALLAEKKLLKKADHLIATEENVASRFLKKNTRTSIVYNYSFFPPEETSAYEKIFDAIYCGTLTESKGILLMLDALIHCKKQGSELKFVFVGGFGSTALEETVKTKIETNDLSENLFFTGKIPIEKINQYYKKSKIALCLFPKNRTNQLILPIKLFEYMSFGLPIVGSDFGHIQKIISSDKVGIAVNPHDPEKVSEAILELLSDEKYKKYAAHSVNLVNEKYLWKSQEPVLLDVYSKLLD